MSQAQERRRAEAWETHHKERYENSVEELRKMKVELDKLLPSSPEYVMLKSQYDEQYKAAEAFFVKYYES